MLKLAFRLLLLVSVTVVLFFLVIYFNQHRLIYFPQASSEEEIATFIQSGGVRIDYETDQGKQTAWLQPARGNRAPERFWLVCGGNGTRALQMSHLQGDFNLENDAFLLMDYPGYGASQGSPSPKAIQENLRIAVPLATKQAGFPIAELPARGIVFGHSLGCAATLLGAEMYGIKRGVLLAPFTSTMEMSGQVLRLPLPVSWLVSHRFDNRENLGKMAARGGHVWIFHGDSDEAIPTRMGRDLAKEMGRAATYREVKNGWHNDLFEKAHQEIAEAMLAARRQ